MASRTQGLTNHRLVIGIAGRIGAGKTSAAKHISSTFNFQYLRYSEVLAAWRAAGPDNKAELQSMGWDVMEKGLQPELNRRLIEKIRPGSSAVVDGLRHPVDHDSLSAAFQSSFQLIYLDADLQTRWAHVRGRGRHSTFEQFQAADSHPVEQNIELLRARSSLTIPNDGSLPELFSKMDSAIERFRKEGRA